MKLDDLALFLTVVRCGSFALAAKQKALSSSTLSRRIQQLEHDIGSILLIRSSKEIVLTKEGEQLFESYAGLFAEIEAKQAAARKEKQEYRGTIVINAPIIPLRHQLSPLALEFCQLHPNVNIHFQVGAGMDYFARNDIDIALRFGPQPHSDWVARKLANNPSQLCCTPNYADSLNLTHPSQLLTLPLLTLNTKQPWVFAHKQTGEKFQFTPKARLSSEELDTILQATLMDMGVARLPKGLISQELAQQQLIPLLAQWNIEGADVYLLHPQRRFLPERTQVFIDYINTHWSRVAFKHWLN